ncbi:MULTISPECIES: bifunctional hydroxymethylpyrimidine kinase/phosphomethylpyrimidine kinase [Neisseria]|uniref:bifunctional hydroxymethylpyrimidine kinase/phosphomethylpyrimidine kinase n=1 Tax=Neisseria TaxID=482 RepID=UPI0006CADC50|nr:MULTISPECIES: bifunctional hydroxymethylpyrimidine kinase/phosphomethylpyrimidine kinase [Neisseria]KPN73760.1 hydroxymethylpyrimidine kinase [Neisseria sp. 74A18]OSI16172.1 bifunctional hydroxymethylpyrimidine kinase/phosphomethylpyrimidine kinase [Neisseria dumasiana]
MASKPLVRALTIAGSDSGGGAGIQADLKTFGALGAYGASIVTAVTAQNTRGVQAVHVIPPEIIAAQCESVFSDIRIDAVKIGMLPDVESIKTVAAALRKYSGAFVVLDPVLVATSGDRLSVEDTVETLCSELLPLADVITPNLEELAKLTGNSLAKDEQEMLAQGKQLMEKGAAAALLKGGHWENSKEARDWLLTEDYDPQCFRNSRIDTPNTHGTGCTLAAAIAALRPQRSNLGTAVAAAKNYLHGAIEAGAGWRVGKGAGPLAHFWRQYRD